MSMRRRPSKNIQKAAHNIKCVALGDGDVGKSSMLLTYLSGHFPEECPPGPMDGHAEFDHWTNHPVTIEEDNVEVHLTLVDTYGQDEYDKLREKVCASGDVYMLCYDVSKPSALDRLRHHWIPEMRRYSSEETPFIVVGLKTDIRSKAQADGSDINKFMTFSEGQKQAAEMGAAQYIECSAKNNTGIKRVLEKAVQTALQHAAPNDLKRGSCVVS